MHRLCALLLCCSFFFCCCCYCCCCRRRRRCCWCCCWNPQSCCAPPAAAAAAAAAASAGANQPWLHYGSDFGNHRPSESDYCTLKNDFLVPLQRAGGHTLRFWLFIEGSGGIPSWAPDGTVNGTDAANSLASDMRRYVQLAASMDIVIIWCLWNGAVLRDSRTLDMITEPSGAALKTFVDKALTPLVTALKSEPGVGAWEVINEPEGSVAANVRNSESCFDTRLLKNTGAGWAQLPAAKGKSGAARPLPMRDLQRFVAVQAAAIHAADPNALVTVGSWNAVANTDVDGHRNYWSDECLRKAAAAADPAAASPILSTAGGAPTLDFYQIHSYPSGGAFNGESPFGGLNKSDYALDKPLVIGEFPAAALNGGYTDTQLYEYAYAAGFDGAWGWALNADTKNDQTLEAVRKTTFFHRLHY
jgi:mannan endo-1,4-beta-mannosidase